VTSAEIDKIAYRCGYPTMMVAHPSAIGEFTDALRNYAFLLFDKHPSLLHKRAGLRQAVRTPLEFSMVSNLAVISFLGVSLLRQSTSEGLSTLLAITGVRLGEPNTLNGLKSLGHRPRWHERIKVTRETALQARQEFDDTLAMILESVRQPMSDSAVESLCGFGFELTREHGQNFVYALDRIGRSPKVNSDIFLDLLLVNRLISALRFAHNGPSLDEGILIQILFGDGKLSTSLLSGWTQNLPTLIDNLRDCAKPHYAAGIKPFMAAELAAQDCFLDCLRNGQLLSHRNNTVIADVMCDRIYRRMVGEDKQTE
jgi:hypothetical protein